MTGPEFATAHGNDASTWSPADIEAEFVFAEIDAYNSRALATVTTLPTRTTPAASPKGAA